MVLHEAHTRYVTSLYGHHTLLTQLQFVNSWNNHDLLACFLHLLLFIHSICLQNVQLPKASFTRKVTSLLAKLAVRLYWFVKFASSCETQATLLALAVCSDHGVPTGCSFPALQHGWMLQPGAVLETRLRGSLPQVVEGSLALRGMPIWSHLTSLQCHHFVWTFLLAWWLWFYHQAGKWLTVQSCSS